MSTKKPNTSGLIPAEKGNQLAAKPAHLHKSKVINIRVTADELAAVNRMARAEGLSVSKFVREKIGL